MGSTTTETGTSASSGNGSEPSPLEVLVLFTDISAALRALRTATQLAQGMTARIPLLPVETVPYPLPLGSPQRNIRFLRRQFRTLIENRTAEPACRWVAFGIVIGKRWDWWPRTEDRLANKLRSAGHHVVRITTPARGLPALAWKGLAHA